MRENRMAKLRGDEATRELIDEFMAMTISDAVRTPPVNTNMGVGKEKPEEEEEEEEEKEEDVTELLVDEEGNAYAKMGSSDKGSGDEEEMDDGEDSDGSF